MRLSNPWEPGFPGSNFTHWEPVPGPRFYFTIENEKCAYQYILHTILIFISHLLAGERARKELKS